MLHCDLKPGNLLLDSSQDLRVADFGQAWLQEDHELPLGTLFYMPPEQARLDNLGLPNAGWDIYALGATFYQLLTGRLPRATPELEAELSQRSSTREVLDHYALRLSRSTLQPVRRLNSSIDRDLAAVVEHCLEIDPSRRYADMGGLLRDLQLRRQLLPLTCRPYSAGYVMGRFIRRNRLPLAVAGVATGLLIITVGVAFQRVVDEADRSREAVAQMAYLQSTHQEGEESLRSLARSVDQSSPRSELSSLRRRAFHLQLQIRPALIQRKTGLTLADKAGPTSIDPARHRLLVVGDRVGVYDWALDHYGWLAGDRPRLAQFTAAGPAFLEAAQLRLPDGQTVKGRFDWMKFSPDGQTLVAGRESSKQVEVHIFRQGKSLGAPITLKIWTPGLGDCAFSPDGRSVALLCGSQLSVLGLNPPRKVWSSLEAGAGQVFYPDERTLAVRTRERLNLLEASSGKSILCIDPPQGQLGPAAMGQLGQSEGPRIPKKHLWLTTRGFTSALLNYQWSKKDSWTKVEPQVVAQKSTPPAWSRKRT